MLPPGDFRRCLPTGQRGRVAELRARSVNDIYFSSPATTIIPRVASRSKLPKSDLDWSFAGKVERAGGELRALARAPCGRKPMTFGADVSIFCFCELGNKLGMDFGDGAALPASVQSLWTDS
jgi:hypothetical protein